MKECGQRLADDHREKNRQTTPGPLKIHINAVVRPFRSLYISILQNDY